MNDLRRALSLLTILPVRAHWDDKTAPGPVMATYPLAGAVIGAILLALAAGLAWTGVAVRAPLLAAALLTAAWAVFTGALHLDGWADCCDALFVPVSRERRLEILKDPRLGSFGGAGLVLLLLVKLGAIHDILGRLVPGGPTGLPFVSILAGLLPLFAAPVSARWAVVIEARVFPSARPDGMAAYFRRGLGTRQVVLATLTTAIMVLPLGIMGALLWLCAGAALWALARLANARLGGLTGDVYGATVELIETVALIAACLMVR